MNQRRGNILYYRYHLKENIDPQESSIPHELCLFSVGLSVCLPLSGIQAQRAMCIHRGVGVA